MALHTLIVPLFNEFDALTNSIPRFVEFLDKSSESFEVIFVNDGSSDRSGELIDELCQKDQRFKAIHFTRNFGKEGAMLAGMAYSSGDTCTVLDADLQDPLSQVLVFIEAWKRGYKLVYGERTRRDGDSAFKRLTSYVFLNFLSRIASYPIPTNSSDFQLIDKKIVQEILSSPERGFYYRGQVHSFGMKSLGIKYQKEPRKAGKSKFGIRAMSNYAAEALITCSNIPPRLITLLGISLVCVGLLVAIQSLWINQATASLPAPASFTLLTLVIGGLIIFCLGVVGEYVGRILFLIRNRPSFSVEQTTGFNKSVSDIPSLRFKTWTGK
jgi:dolichol-phosphate mannosyltransferase